MTFSRPLFLMQFTRTMSDWAMTAPPRAMMPKDFPDRFEAAKRAQALSQTRGGFAAPSGLGYEPTASALPRNQTWNAPSYKRPEDPRWKKKLDAVTPSLLKQLPHDYIPLDQRPGFA